MVITTKLYCHIVCQRILKAKLCFLTENIGRRFLCLCLVLSTTSENLSVEMAVSIGISCNLVKTVIELGRIFGNKIKVKKN